MQIFKDKRTRVLIFAMSTLFILAILIANFYFKYQNKSVDPRIVEANILYDKYNNFAQSAEFDSVFVLMDSIESIYQSLEHYSESYEVGVLYNNRAAAYITMAIGSDSTEIEEKDSVLRLGEVKALKSIDIYETWLDKWSNKNIDEIKDKISPYFSKDDTAFQNKNTSRFINKRAGQISEAQVETRRRLSVSYTNLGIIYRHSENYDEAVQMYLTALELWPDNLAAENNLNVLFDKPLKKRSIIRKLFPKERISD